MSAPASEEQLLAVAQAAARAAGAELVARFGQEPVDVQTKTTPTDPVSAADLAAEEAIRDLLARERPDDAILGEEGGATGGGSGLRWVVDPLDGTVNFLYGIPAFGVSIACEDEAGALAGVVLDPVRDECFAAVRSGEPLLNGAAISASQVDSLDRALVATGFGYDPAIRRAQAGTIAELLPRVRDIRRAGAAALDLAACACGRVDAYFERGVKPWDIAAGALLCERAGLAVRMLEQVPSSDREPALPAGILVAPPAIVDELYAWVSGARIER